MIFGTQLDTSEKYINNTEQLDFSFNFDVFLYSLMFLSLKRELINSSWNADFFNKELILSDFVKFYQDNIF